MRATTTGLPGQNSTGAVDNGSRVRIYGCGQLSLSAVRCVLRRYFFYDTTATAACSAPEPVRCAQSRQRVIRGRSTPASCERDRTAGSSGPQPAAGTDRVHPGPAILRRDPTGGDGGWRGRAPMLPKSKRNSRDPSAANSVTRGTPPQLISHSRRAGCAPSRSRTSLGCRDPSANRRASRSWPRCRSGSGPHAVPAPGRCRCRGW